MKIKISKIKKLRSAKEIAQKSTKKVPAKKVAPKKEIVIKSISDLQRDPPKGVAGIVHQITAGNRLDGAIGWISPKAGKSYIKKLLIAAPTMSTKVTKSDKYLVITGLKRLFFWKLDSLSGDTYTRNHPADSYTSEDVSVRGSVKLLKSTFGPENVQIANQSTVIRLKGTLKSDVSCLKAA